MKHLAVFVHGWGANSSSWWGTTKNSLKTQLDTVEFYFHEFDTGKSPESWVTQVKEYFGKKAKHQGFGDLGQALWVNIKERYKSKAYESVVLFGHSFGGLVIADAIKHAAERSRSGSRNDDDIELLNAITAIGCCATPFAGAQLAEVYEFLCKSFGKNRHIDAMQRQSNERKTVVDSFIAYIQNNTKHLTLFRADGDGVVTSDELYGPFKIAELSYSEKILRGTHSECIKNLGFDTSVKGENLTAICKWLKQSIDGKEGNTLLQRNDFKGLIGEVKDDLGREPYYSWKKNRKASDVSDDYMLRLILQKLVHAAAHLHPRSLGSANLWVGHVTPDGNGHLRSEEREGFFAIKQLVNFAGWNQAGRCEIGIRPAPIHDSSSSEFRHCLEAVKAYVLGEVIFASIRSASNQSTSDLEAGVTHVLAIPLYKKTEKQLGSEGIEGAPLAISVDFHFDSDPHEEVASEIKSAAQELTEAFEILRNCWHQAIRLQSRAPTPRLDHRD